MRSRLLNTIRSIFLILTTALTSIAAERNCAYFNFPEQKNLNSWISTSLAKIYDDENGNGYLGTGTVIDAEKGLLITACHTVHNGVVYVQFPALQDGRRYRATVEAIIDQADGEIEAAGESWNEPRDIAILKVNHPLDYVTSAEIWMCKINLNDKLYFFGFSDNAATPVPGEAMPSIPTIPDTETAAACTFDLREATEDGDSGSPVVNSAGLIVGVMIQSRNQSRAGRFVPVKCFSSWLLDLLEDNIVEESVSLIADKPIGILSGILQPPPRTDWITNLRFASAIDRAARDEQQIQRIRNKHECPIRWAIVERGLGMDLYDRYHTRLIQSSQTKEEAEAFQRRGEIYAKAQLSEMAFTLFHAAIHRYQKFLTDIPSKFESKNLLLTAQAYKGMADVQTRLAELTGNDKLLAEAKLNFILAAFFTPKDKNELRGSAIAAFGVASQRTGDPQTAIEAYSSAAQLGYRTQWMSQNYDAAFMRRDQIPEATFAPDYEPIGLYRGISLETLRNYLDQSN